MTIPPLPRWYWVLPVVAVLAWWPLQPWWQSDDFLAVHHVQRFANVLHDFAGPQYGATDVWAFYRPLVTLSFWLDQQLGGAFPPLSHCSNVVAHGASAMLVACLWRRFLPAGAAFCGGLLWALLPSHQGSIAWAVGRVDSHTTVWCLAAVLAVLRRQERAHHGQPPRAWPLALATAAALASKESALVVPALATLAAFARTGGPVAARAGAAFKIALPAWLLLLAYVPLRLVVLGGFGGYQASAAAYDPAAMAGGLATGLANVVVPLRWVGMKHTMDGPTTLWLVAAATPAVVAVLLALWRAPRLALGSAAVFLVAALPIASFLPAADNPQTLRLYYLPSVALCGLLAAGGRASALAVLLAVAWPFVAMRGEQRAADRETGAMHQALLREAADGAADPLFVAGLPHANAAGTVVQLHFGVDRLLQPPFTAAPRRLYALRPLFDTPDAFRLHDAGEPPWPLPAGSTWYFATAQALVATWATTTLPDLPLTGDDGGAVDLTTERLDTLLPADAPKVALRTPGVRQPVFRVTVFTAGGYLATVFFDHAGAAAADGEIDLRRWFAGDANQGDPLRREAARFAASGAAYIGEALPIPTTVDLVPEFPVLVEAGTLGPGFRFVPSHRARRLLTFRFDRGYTGWMHRAHGDR